MNHTRMPAEATPQAERQQERDTEQGEGRHARADAMRWQRLLAPYAQPPRGRALLDLATSSCPTWPVGRDVLSLACPYWSRSRSRSRPPASSCARTSSSTTAPTARSCGPSARTRGSGASLGLIVLRAVPRWRHDHAVHHASSGDLDRRGVGDLRTLTVAEYRALAPRPVRLPPVPQPAGDVRFRADLRDDHRTAHRLPARAPSDRRSVIATNFALVALVGGLCWLIGWRDYLLVQGPPRCSPARPASGCSTYSISSRTPTGRAAANGATPMPRCAGAPT